MDDSYVTLITWPIRLTEWREKPSRATHLRLSEALRRENFLNFPDAGALEWALALPGPLGEVSDVRRLALEAVLAVAERRRSFAIQVRLAAVRTGTSRARDVAIRSLLCLAATPTSLEYVAALELALACPREARHHLRSVRIDRKVSPIRESEGGLDVLPDQIAPVEYLCDGGGLMKGAWDDEAVEEPGVFATFPGALTMWRRIPSDEAFRYFDAVNRARGTPRSRDGLRLRVMVCGSRDFSNLPLVEALVRSLPPDAIVLSGGAPGVDREAERAAKERHLYFELHRADWKAWGAYAGPLRNSRMVEAADVVHAFLSRCKKCPSRAACPHRGRSHGTADSIDRARASYKPLTIHLESGRTRSWNLALQGEGRRRWLERSR